MEKEITNYFFECSEEYLKTFRPCVKRICKLCREEFSGLKGNFFNFANHIASSHGKELSEFEKNPKCRESSEEQSMQVKFKYLSASKNMNRKIVKLEKMLIASGISLDIVHNSEFKDFVEELDPSFRAPYTKKLKRDLPIHHESVEITIADLLKEAPFIITSFDVWVTKYMVTYFSVTAHYLTKYWNYEHKFLTLKRILGIPNEAAIIDEYKTILHKFGINNVFLNIASNTVNVLNTFQLKFQGGDNEKTVYDLSSSCRDDYTFDEFLDANNNLNIESCQINGIINQNEGFVYMLMSIIKESIQNDTVLIETLQACGDILSYIRLSDLNDKELQMFLQQCLDASQVSAIHMFKKFSVIYHEVISILQNTGYECWLLSQTQHEILLECILILQPFLEAIDFVFNDSPAFISKCLPTIIALVRHLLLLETTYLQPLKESLISSLEKRFEGIYEDPVYVISTILNPSWKMAPFIDSDKQIKAKKILIDELSKISESSVDFLRNKKNDNFFDKASSDSSRTYKSEPDAKKSRLSLMFQVFKKNNQQIIPGYEMELDLYFKDDDIEEDVDPLLFWKMNEVKYPRLSILARKYLAIPAISMPIETIRTLTDDIVKDRTNFIMGDLFSQTAVLKYNMGLF